MCSHTPDGVAAVFTLTTADLSNAGRSVKLKHLCCQRVTEIFDDRDNLIISCVGGTVRVIDDGVIFMTIILPRTAFLSVFISFDGPSGSYSQLTSLSWCPG